jgi:biotin carboxyl carrier protein
MKIELTIDNINDFNVEFIRKEENLITYKVNDKIYTPDIVKVSEGLYSIILDGKSYNVEVYKDITKKSYVIKTFQHSFNIDIIDSETKYLKNRTAGIEDEGNVVISSPMPGKVVKILVKIGDHVNEDQTVIVVEAMKMQSEYKVKKDRLIKEIKVKEGDTVAANQPLIIVE